MAIIASSFTAGPPQVDGRVWVSEVHTDDAGNEYLAEYLAGPKTDHGAIMKARAVQIAEQIAADAVTADEARVTQEKIAFALLDAVDAKLLTEDEAASLVALDEFRPGYEAVKGERADAIAVAAVEAGAAMGGKAEP